MGPGCGSMQYALSTVKYGVVGTSEIPPQSWISILHSLSQAHDSQVVPPAMIFRILCMVLQGPHFNLLCMNGCGVLRRSIFHVAYPLFSGGKLEADFVQILPDQSSVELHCLYLVS